MSKAKLEELEASNAEMALTIAAQSDTIIDQMNRELMLRREITALRAQLNGQPKEVTA